MKLGSCTQSGHGLALGGRHFENNNFFWKQNQTKDKSKENPLIYINYSQCHPEPHPFIFKGKLQKQRIVRLQLVYIQNFFYKFVIFRLLPQTTAHLSLQITTCLNQWSLGDNWPKLYKKQKNRPNWNPFLSLNYCHNHPLGLSTLRPLNPNPSHLCHVSKAWDAFQSISQGGWQWLIALRWEMRPHWMQKTVLTTFIEDPSL